ncbi:GNAT family N-acetyltransferase [Marinobacterium marinum]|uniref:GNAT family N-acetyltransferase n=1 Tax=Marinobacterium marinum TaxID=2756129 RepID=A0A7W1WYE9_9GAMM|nr:GNAT family N-acetyltransferase [Marinobacterium marinum]MBA4502539.1 GNAT family N-acetyltransferase [Marinobacterium marinum]
MYTLIKVDFREPNAEAIRAVREEVFIREQKVPKELEFDDLDVAAVHVLVMADDRPVGTGRILADGHIGRIAILKAFRGRGLGAKVVSALMEEAARAGCERVYLGAQTHAIDFYGTLGFSRYGDVFMDAGIPHVHMEKYL